MAVFVMGITLTYLVLAAFGAGGIDALLAR
jgi:hypothetical protein